MFDHLTSAVVSLGIAAIGTMMSLGASILAVAGSGDVSPWVQVGGTATAVGALAYVAKLLADGRLVAQPIADLIKAAERRENDLKQLLELSHSRENDLRSLLIQQHKDDQ